jgi:hypothetical protein
MNIKPETSKDYFPTQKYDTLDRTVTLLSASSVQVYWAGARQSKFISIFSLSKMHADATFRVDELFLRQTFTSKLVGGRRGRISRQEVSVFVMR